MYGKKDFIVEPFPLGDREAHSSSPDVIRCLQFPSFSGYERLAHGVFTRHGGVSKSPYDSLNTSYNVGDRPEDVRENLQIVKEMMGATHLRPMNQVHGSNIFVMRQGFSHEHQDLVEADAISSDIPYLALMVRQADCQGVILYDPVNSVVSIVHCGWRGNRSNILSSMVERMKSVFGSRESELIAGIGPSLGPCCAEFTTYRQIFPREFMPFMVRENYFDLWRISQWQLLQAGLKEENIAVARICTRCRTDLFYSYRAEGVTGRFTTVAMLKNG